MEKLSHVGRPGVRWSGLALCACGALLLSGPAAAQGIACGDVVSGVVQLEEDLICTTEPALRLDGGRLNLRGNTVICDGTLQGIVLEGDGARLRNGNVAGCLFAVLLEGGGAHVVSNVCRFA